MNNTIITNSISKSFTYEQYRLKIKNLLDERKSTGLEQSEILLEYSLLNDKRMDRLDKTLKVTDETLNSLSQLNKPFTFLVISEGWCGDAAQIVPVLNKIASASTKINLKIVFRDENEELMNQFLTNGSKSIPKTILLDANNQVITSWGPRPSIATKMVLDYKEKNGVIDDEFKKNLQLWYNKDKGNSTQNDIIKLLKAS
ncbi:thioredoxin family protein [uncultured Lutibacter sp.]|uniref:thioredoxin family protein n=1 Tax=Lutibacter sp. TaxID=1925666 RepID=UPI002627C3DD|nr:thioredoxin family protein [uncultured Lutibacter sp.]